MNIARVIHGVVVNIEVADEEWLNANSNSCDARLVEIPDNEIAHIGLGWSPEAGFEQPREQVSTPGPGQKWDFGNILGEGQDYDSLAAEIEAALAGE